MGKSASQMYPASTSFRENVMLVFLWWTDDIFILYLIIKCYVKIFLQLKSSYRFTDSSSLLALKSIFVEKNLKQQSRITVLRFENGFPTKEWILSHDFFFLSFKAIEMLQNQGKLIYLSRFGDTSGPKFPLVVVKVCFWWRLVANGGSALQNSRVYQLFLACTGREYVSLKTHR